MLDGKVQRELARFLMTVVQSWTIPPGQHHAAKRLQYTVVSRVWREWKERGGY